MPGPNTQTGLEGFLTERLSAERLTAGHWDDLRAMDGDAGYMAHLGGVRDEAGTQAYLDRNLAHWTEHGYGLYMLRDRESGTAPACGIVSSR